MSRRGSSDNNQCEAKGSCLAEEAPAVGIQEPEYDAQGRRLHRCGSLTYTNRTLVILFCWLLWGDFCFNLMETVLPSIFPLKLKSLGAANWTIALIMSTLPGVFNTTVCPWVSFKSDHYRSRWGRRIPFILCTMPFLTASLLLIAYSDNIGGWVHQVFFNGSSFSRNAVMILLLAVFAAMFDLFNMFVSSVYFCLYNDVVPEHYQSRFMGWSRLISVISVALYNYFIYQFALSHMREIYTGAAVLYFFGFGLMCLNVKEGEYPPPPDSGEAPSLLRDIQTFAKECFTIPFYWLIFFGTMFAAVSATIVGFNVFAMQSLGLDLGLIGKAGAYYGVMVGVCLTFAGVLADRWHPVRVDAYMNAFNLCFLFVNLLWIFIDPPPATLFFRILVGGNAFAVLLAAIGGTAYMPRMMHLFPKGRFGAFCGAQAMVRSAGAMVGGLLAGLFLDWIKGWFPADSLRAYRYVPVWQLVFAALTFVCSYHVYRYWKRLGGDTGFKPPLTRVRYSDLPLAEDSRVRKGMLVPLLIAWCGILLANAFYCLYFLYFAPNLRSAIFSGAVTGIVILLLPVYLRFLRFMERP